MLAAAAVVLIALAAGGVYLYPRGPRRGETVIACTRRPDDQSIYGVVHLSSRRGLALRGARLLQADGTSLPMSDVWVPAAGLSFVQRNVDAILPDPPTRDQQAPPLPSNRQMTGLREG